MLKVAEELLIREVLSGDEVRRIAFGEALEETPEETPEEPVVADPVASDSDMAPEAECQPVVPTLGKPLAQE